MLCQISADRIAPTTSNPKKVNRIVLTIRCKASIVSLPWLRASESMVLAICAAALLIEAMLSVDSLSNARYACCEFYRVRCLVTMPCSLSSIIRNVLKDC